MRLVHVFVRRLGIASELLTFFLAHKRFWLLPMLLALLFFAVLIILAESSVIAPFIYTLF